jgi:acyl-homoserine-lactone acylase
MALEFLDDGPRANAILTYSQSPDADSAHFTDQTLLYTEQRLRPVRYTEEDILADLVETVEISD